MVYALVGYAAATTWHSYQTDSYTHASDPMAGGLQPVTHPIVALRPQWLRQPELSAEGEWFLSWLRLS